MLKNHENPFVNQFHQLVLSFDENTDYPRPLKILILINQYFLWLFNPTG